MPAASWDAWYAGILITSRGDAAAPSLSTSPRRGEGKRAVFFLNGPGGGRKRKALACYIHARGLHSFAVVTNKVVVAAVAVIVLLSGAARSELVSTPWLTGNVETKQCKNGGVVHCVT